MALQLPSDRLNPALGDAGLEVMNFLNQVSMRYPQAISFAPGRPPERLFGLADSLPSIERFFAEGDRSLLHLPEQHGIDSLGQYGRTNGIIGAPLARLLEHDENVVVSPQDIVVTAGAQEALCLCLNVLCGSRGDVALTIEPSYIGFFGAARMMGIEVVGVPCGDAGVDIGALGRTVHALAEGGKHARVLYLNTDYANPTGLSLPLPARRALLQAAAEHDLLLIEDAAYNYFCYDGAPAPALKALPGGDRVVYIGSFAKSVFPGARVGFAVADQVVTRAGCPAARLADEMSKVKSLLTVNTSPLMQALVGGVLLANDYSLREYVRPRVRAMQRSRDAMLEALEDSIPRNAGGQRCVTWNRPSGGFFLSLNMPRPILSEDLLTCARDFGVTWTPMSFFHIDPAPSAQIRLSFSYVAPEVVREGIGRLAAWMRSAAFF
ncbi:MAG TPA: PLP-dependent aminotransferase family protein [Burkholderiaceae bacterium]|nr:PLP-dependent aminotransferase family protein [Burkholderiaceae bacterium]